MQSYAVECNMEETFRKHSSPLSCRRPLDIKHVQKKVRQGLQGAYGEFNHQGQPETRHPPTVPCWRGVYKRRLTCRGLTVTVQALVGRHCAGWSDTIENLAECLECFMLSQVHMSRNTQSAASFRREPGIICASKCSCRMLDEGIAAYLVGLATSRTQARRHLPAICNLPGLPACSSTP